MSLPKPVNSPVVSFLNAYGGWSTSCPNFSLVTALVLLLTEMAATCGDATVAPLGAHFDAATCKRAAPCCGLAAVHCMPLS